MTPREILLHAAERIAAGEENLCCIAIDNMRYSFSARDAADTHFRSLFSTNIPRGMLIWNSKPTPERQNLRTLCLLFAAWSYEEEK